MNRNNGEKGFKENLFEFYSLSLEHQTSGKAKVTIVWILSMVELLAYTFNCVSKSGIVASPSVDMIAQFLKYAELEQLKSLSTFLYTTITTTIKILILVNHAMFLIFVLDKLRFLRIKKITQIYCSYNFYKVFILAVPFSEIVMKDLIGCARPDLDLLMLVFNTAVLSILVFDMLKQTFFLQFDFFSKDNYLVSFDSHFYIKMISVKFFVCFLLFFGFTISNRIVNVLSLVLLWLATLVTYAYLSVRVIFEKLSIQKVINCFTGIYLALVTSLALSCVSSNFHFLFGFLLMSLLSMIIPHFLQPNAVRLHSDEMLKNPRHLLQFVQNYLNTTKKYEPNSQTSIRLKGFFNFHIMKCLSPSCFCGKSSFYTSSKNGYISANKNEKVSLFTKHLIKEKLEEVCLLNPASQIHKYVLALFIFKKLKNKIQAMNIVKAVGGEACCFSNQFKFYRLCRAISKDQEENNKDKLREKKFEELLHFEETSNHFIRLISDLFFQLNSFWTYMMSNGTICPNVFAKETSKILQIKTECKALLKVMESFNNYSDRLKFLHGFFKRELLNIKIADKLDELFLNLEDEEQPEFSADLTILNANFYNTFLHNTSCVFEVGMHPLTVGIIQRVSESVYNVFGYQKTEMIGKSINQLMPEPIAKSHDQILLDVYQKGILLSKTNSMLSWAITKNRSPMAVKVKYRIDLTRDANIVLTGVAVRVESATEPNYFIITDDLGFVVSLSDVFVKRLNIKESDIRDKRINIGMLSSQLLMQLPINEVFQKPQKGSSEEHSDAKSKKNGERNLTLSIARDEEDLEKLIQRYDGLKKLNEHVLEDFKNGRCRLKYFPITKTDGTIDVNQNEVIGRNQDMSYPYSNVYLAPLDSPKRKSIGSRKLLQMHLDEKDTCHIRNDKSIDNYLISSGADCNYLNVMVDMELRRHSRVKSFNAFIITKIKENIEPRSTPENHRNSLANKQSNANSKLSCAKERVPLNSSHKDESLEEPGICAKSESLVKESNFLPHIKNSLNYFHKENNQIPHKRYPRLLRLNLVVLAVVTSNIIFELIFLIFSKVPLLTSMKQTAMEYYDITGFERDIINTYSYLISNTLNGTSINSTIWLFDRIAKAKETFRSDSVIKYVFDPYLNPRFVHIYIPEVELNMNNAFLVQNYLYEMNKYLTGINAPADFSRDSHTLLMVKYKSKLLDFFKELKELFTRKFENHKSTNEYYFLYVCMASLAFFFCLIVIILIYMNMVLRRIFAINDTILYTDEVTISAVINYYALAQNFFNDQFVFDGNLFSQKATYRSMVCSNTFMREKKKKWRSHNKLNRKNLLIFNLMFLLLMLMWTMSYIGRYYFEFSLYTAADDSRKLAGSVLSDASAIAQLIMLAKEFYIDKNSLKIVDAQVVNYLGDCLEPTGLLRSNGNSVEAMVGEYYTQNFCKFINQTELTMTTPCETIYNSLLRNDINSIKNLLKSKLGFVFTQVNAQSYNYTESDVPKLDEVNIFIENGICSILKAWKVFFEDLIRRSTFYLTLLTIACISLGVFCYFFYVTLIESKLMALYKHERSVFMHFMPKDTLKKTKLAQVQLRRDQILRFK